MVKRGQLFLIAALIISIIILSLGYIYNTTSSAQTDTTVYDLSSQINFEGAKVIDYGVIKGDTPNIPINLKKLIDGYSATSPQSSFIILYGNQDSIQMSTKTPLTASSSYGDAEYTTTLTPATWCDKTTTTSGTSTSCREGGTNNYDKSYATITHTDANNKIVTVTLADGTKHSFDLKKGENFYLIIRKETGDNVVVSEG